MDGRMFPRSNERGAFMDIKSQRKQAAAHCGVETHPWTSPPRDPKRPPLPLPRSPLDAHTQEIHIYIKLYGSCHQVSDRINQCPGIHILADSYAAPSASEMISLLRILHCLCQGLRYEDGDVWTHALN